MECLKDVCGSEFERLATGQLEQKNLTNAAILRSLVQPRSSIWHFPKKIFLPETGGWANLGNLDCRFSRFCTWPIRAWEIDFKRPGLAVRDCGNPNYDAKAVPSPHCCHFQHTLNANHTQHNLQKQWPALPPLSPAPSRPSRRPRSRCASTLCHAFSGGPKRSSVNLPAHHPSSERFDRVAEARWRAVRAHRVRRSSRFNS